MHQWPWQQHHCTWAIPSGPIAEKITTTHFSPKHHWDLWKPSHQNPQPKTSGRPAFSRHKGGNLSGCMFYIQVIHRFVLVSGCPRKISYLPKQESRLLRSYLQVKIMVFQSPPVPGKLRTSLGTRLGWGSGCWRRGVPVASGLPLTGPVSALQLSVVLNLLIGYAVMQVFIKSFF